MLFVNLEPWLSRARAVNCFKELAPPKNWTKRVMVLTESSKACYGFGKWPGNLPHYCEGNKKTFLFIIKKILNHKTMWD